MQANETTVEKVFTGEKILVVPRYQRRYSWDGSDWASLWRAVERQYHAQSDGAPTHFLGSVVIAQRQAFPTEASNYDVIDGQQRLTTLLILLAAIRSEVPEGDTNRSRAESYLKNSFEEGEYSFKVRPGDADRDNFNLVLEGNSESAAGLVKSAYVYFVERVRDLRASVQALDYAALVRAATKRLEVVQILAAPEDNAHRIFQTLNSTGKELTAVDLLRNHFFMLLPSAMDSGYEQYWRPMQDYLGELFTSFLWIDLVTRPGFESIPNEPKRIYAEWQTLLDPLSGDESQVLAMLGELRMRAENYGAMRAASTGDEPVDRALRRLNEWGVSVHHPLTFAILEMWRTRKADTARTVTALQYVESFLVRRMLAGVATNNLNRLFTTSVGQLSSDDAGSVDLDVAVHRILSQPGKYWPSDEALMLEGLKSPFYLRQRAPQRAFVLRRLEETYTGKYAPDWGYCKFSIEHVLPQTPTKWWLEHLADTGENEPSLAHAELVHSIGNLTLTCENPELGQMNLAEKSAIYQADLLKMNDSIAKEQAWGRSQIMIRGEDLIRRAAQVWPAPMPAQSQDDHALSTEIRTVLGALDRGLWVDGTTLSEFLDVQESELDRALTILDGHPLADLVLSGGGELRESRAMTGTREGALENLVEAGVIGSAEEMPAAAESRAGVEKLEGTSGG